MVLRFEAWTLPTATTFEKKFDITEVLPGATGVKELSGWSDASMPVPASWDDIDNLVTTADASLVAVFNGSTLIDEFIAQRCPFSTHRPSIRLVSGPGINGIVEKCGIYPLKDGVDDWIWGSDVNLLENPGFEENSVTPAVWELQITATGGTYTLTDGTDTTAPIAFDAQAGTIATRLQNDIASITDVDVTGTSIAPYNRTINFLDPPYGITLAINTGSLTGGSGTLMLAEAGGEEPRPWTNARSITIPEDTSHYDAFEVSTVQARSGTRSLLVDPGLILPLSARQPGIQQTIRVMPNQTYRASGWIWPTSSTDSFRLRVNTLGEEQIAASSPTTLTPGQWNQLTLNNIVIPADVRQVHFRAGLTNSGPYDPDAAWYDDFEFIEGMPANSVQGILDELLSAAHARGTFEFLELDALADEDTNGNALAEIAFTAWYGQDLGHVLDALHALGYNWRIVRADQAQQITPTGTHVLQIYNIGVSPVDHTASPGGPSVKTGGRLESGEVVKRIPEFTAMRARGLADLVVDDENQPALANMGRWERIVDAENISSEAALQMLIDAAFASEDSNQTAATAVVLEGDSSQPLIRFDAGDMIWWEFPGILPNQARPVRRVSWTHEATTRYEVQGSKVLSGDAGIAKAVDYLLRQFQRRRVREDLSVGDVLALLPQPSGGGEMTVTVAASNASDLSKAKADFVCSGIDDHITIMSAYNLMPTFRAGRLRLSEGTFVCRFGEIALTNIRPRLTIEGSGHGTHLEFSGGTGPAIEVNTGSGHNMFKDFSLIGNGSGGPGGILARGQRTHMENLYAENFGGGVLTLAGPTQDSIIRGCWLSGNEGSGIVVQNAAHRLLIANNIVDHSGSSGGRALDAGGSQRFSLSVVGNMLFTGGINIPAVDFGSGMSDLVFTGNLVTSERDIGLVLADSTVERAVIADNLFALCGRSAIYAAAAHDLLIRGNLIHQAAWNLGTEPGIWVQGFGLGGEERIAIVGNTIHNPVGSGITPDGPGIVVESYDRVTISGNTLDDIARDGIVCDTVGDLVVSGNTFTRIGRSSHDTYDAIRISGVTESPDIWGNRTRGTASSPQPRYGVNIAHADVSGAVVVSNDLGAGADYGTDALNNDGTDTVLTFPDHIDYGDNFVET